MDAATRDKYAAAGSRGLGAKGFDWYSRVKLWDEARLLAKTPAALTDDEFQRALYNINRYFCYHATYIGQWHCRSAPGPSRAPIAASWSS